MKVLGVVLNFIMEMVGMLDFGWMLDMRYCSAVAYPSLFILAINKDVSVFSQYEIIDGVRNWNVQFNRLTDMSLRLLLWILFVF